MGMTLYQEITCSYPAINLLKKTSAFAERQSELAKSCLDLQSVPRLRLRTVKRLYSLSGVGYSKLKHANLIKL